MNRFTTAIAAAALALSALTAAPAMAMTNTETTVSYADLDLDTEAGARTMLQRIDHAARAACGAHSGRMSVSERRMMRTCVSETTMQAVTDLRHPMVTALYEGRAPVMTLAAQ